MSKSPIIIIGMHRSGTSMLSRILEGLGVFMGWRKEENNEALFFLSFNKWILRQANSSFDNLYNYKLAGDDFKNLMADLANRYISSVRRVEYLGIKNALRYKSLKDLDFLWGWKDPRNSFTLDVWSKVFPEAKIIHIYRNPIDVAASLKRRALKHKRNFKWSIKKELYMLLTCGHIGYGNFIREENIYEGIKLWEEYVSNIFELEEKLELDILHIKYEEFLENPLGYIKLITAKIGINYKEFEIDGLIKTLNKGRKYAFLEDEALVRIYESIKDRELLKKLGYDSIPV